MPTTCERRCWRSGPSSNPTRITSPPRRSARGGKRRRRERRGRRAGAAAGARHEDVGLEGIAEEDEDDDDETDGEDDESSDSESEADELADDDEEEEEEHGDVGGGSSPVEPEQEDRARRERPRVSREDELDFDREMSRFLGAGVKAADKQATNPLNAAGRVGDAGGTLVGPPPPSGGTVAFRMLTKRGAPKELAVPADGFAAAAAEKRAAEERNARR